MPPIRRGSWSIAGIRLPEFGITERIGNVFGSQRTTQGGSNVLGASTQRATAQRASTPTPQPVPFSRPFVGPIYRGPQTASPRPISTPAFTAQGQQAPVSAGNQAQQTSVPAGNQTQQNDINQQAQTGNEIIDRDYETAINALSGQESSLRTQAGASTEAAQAGFAPARTTIGEEQATRGVGLEREATIARTQEKSGLQQARDLFRQTQQQNIAQLSGAGLTSSSVNEALAERLGVETARRIAGITGSTNEIMQNIAQEKTRIGTFYKQKLVDLETGLGAAIGNIQSQLVSGINQINSARQAAASDKANRRAELLSNAQTQIAQLQANAQNFAQQLQMWQTQRNQSLRDASNFVVSPTDLTGQQRAISDITSLPGVAGFQWIPNVETTNQGYRFTPRLEREKKDEDNLR